MKHLTHWSYKKMSVWVLFSIGLITILSSNNPAVHAASYKKLTPGTTWQWQLSGAVKTTILDPSHNKKKMFDIDMEHATTGLIRKLKSKGITVICYMEVGAWESYREDADSFPDDVKGNALDPPFDEELYLDIRSTKVKSRIVHRLNVAKDKGCQGIEPDIDDAYFEDFDGDYTATSNFTGFPITYSTQLNYNRYLAREAHKRGMSYGLKNGADARFVRDLLSSVDWVLNEQCFEYSECGVYSRVINAGKAVFNVEYNLETSAFCPSANHRNFDSLKKDIELGATPRVPCRKL